MFFIISCNKEYSNIISEAIATESASIDATYKASTLTDTIKNNFWDSGKPGQHWLLFSFSEAKEVKEIYLKGLTDPSSNMNLDILIKTDGSEEFTNIFSKNERIETDFEYKINKEIKDLTELKIILKNDTSWGCIKDLKVIGR